MVGIVAAVVVLHRCWLYVDGGTEDRVRVVGTLLESVAADVLQVLKCEGGWRVNLVAACCLVNKRPRQWQRNLRKRVSP